MKVYLAGVLLLGWIGFELYDVLFVKPDQLEEISDDNRSPGNSAAEDLRDYFLRSRSDGLK